MQPPIALSGAIRRQPHCAAACDYVCEGGCASRRRRSCPLWSARANWEWNTAARADAFRQRSLVGPVMVSLVIMATGRDIAAMMSAVFRPIHQGGGRQPRAQPDWSARPPPRPSSGGEDISMAFDLPTWRMSRCVRRAGHNAELISGAKLAVSAAMRCRHHGEIAAAARAKPATAATTGLRKRATRSHWR